MTRDLGVSRQTIYMALSPGRDGTPLGLLPEAPFNSGKPRWTHKSVGKHIRGNQLADFNSNLTHRVMSCVEPTSRREEGALFS